MSAMTTLPSPQALALLRRTADRDLYIACDGLRDPVQEADIQEVEHALHLHRDMHREDPAADTLSAVADSAVKWEAGDSEDLSWPTTTEEHAETLARLELQRELIVIRDAAA